MSCFRMTHFVLLLKTHVLYFFLEINPNLVDKWKTLFPMTNINMNMEMYTEHKLLDIMLYNAETVLCNTE